MITTAAINGKQVIFVGSERPGTITIFSFTTDITNIQFESIYSGLADQLTNKTWSQLYDDRETGDIDPEDIRYTSRDFSFNFYDVCNITDHFNIIV